jgi:DNA-binding transcriptional regulator YhcF (GntR family)
MKNTTKQEDFRELIARKIISGEFSPGSRLKSYDSIIKELKLSKTTLQMSIEKMKSDGFLRSKNRIGLYVDNHPPCLFNVGLLIPKELGNNLFIQVMKNTIEKTLNHAGYKVFCHTIHQISSEFRIDSCDMYKAALKRLIKGCILIGNIGSLSPKDYFFNIPNFPVIHLGSSSEYCYSLNYDTQALASRCAERLSLKNRNAKTAFLFLGNPVLLKNQYLAAAKDKGLVYDEKWIHYIGVDALLETENIIRLLLSVPASDRPDAIVITDDNLIPFFMEAIRKIGSGALKGIHVLAHCNYPALGQDHEIPICRIGFNSYDASELCLKILGPPGLPLSSDCIQRKFNIKPFFEEEIKKNENS